MKKQSPSRAPIIIIAILFILLVAVGGLFASHLLNTPLAEPLSLRLGKPTAIAAQTVLPATALPVQLPTEPAPTTAPTAAATNVVALPAVVQQSSSSGICGLDGALTLLFTGADFNAGVPPFGADAVRIIKYDFTAQTINIVAFPRDLRLLVDSHTGQGVTQQRLGLAYYDKKTAATGTERQKIEAATGLVAQVLYDNFAVLPDHYLTLQLNSVAGMVDTIGGVDITLPEGITTERHVTFPAGVQTLDGRLSAEYLRAYTPGGDPARLLRQNRYIEALRGKVISAGVIAKAPQLINQFNDSIVTDLTPAELASLACAMEKIPASGTHFYQIGGDMVTPQADGSLIPVIDKIHTLLQTALGDMP